ncbi:MAG TPA: glycoside hydrolase family 9 protein, partial [Prolixibacteraceae bacterium]|nr:glycoside hydrolase family 9 protein [Prolixibacteraceae bacterium]
MRKLICLLFVLGVFSLKSVHSQKFELIPAGYFQKKGVNVMAFDDIYPEGHQGGVSLIMHGHRVATNGDLRLEPTPGQWQPVPLQRDRKNDPENNTITAFMSYPDSSRHMSGFNPMIYPDLVFNYTVTVTGQKDAVIVTVDLDRPIPEQFVGKVGFNLELFPGALFGKPWIMDQKAGVFPLQPNGPTRYEPSNHQHQGDYNPQGKASSEQLAGEGYSPIIADDIVAEPYAVGRKFVVRPDDPYNRFMIQSETSDLKLYDGRMNHNNGWFVVRSEVPAGKTKEAIKWVITPNVVEDWLYEPVVQTSQVGYHSNQDKVAVIELDSRDDKRYQPSLYKFTENGEEEVLVKDAQEWGDFLRYDYLKFDFTEINEPGLYQVRYNNSMSSVFRISKDIFERGVWQPVLEYFLPVQMCHMRVNEKYRVWHDVCHMDDARMAPVDFNHIDGYRQGKSTMTKYNPGDEVPGLNIGGWHDAGDFDLRVESQAGETYILSLAYEAFDVDYDVTSIDQHKGITEIHEPDGKADLLQQIENGALTVLGGYNSLGRLYRGIICNGLRQYVMLGDASAMTDNEPGNDDDRWVFTEDNPRRELTTAAQMAAASRVLKGFNDTLSQQALACALELYNITDVDEHSKTAKIHAASELYLTTEDDKYKSYLLAQTDYITKNISRIGWYLGRAEKKMDDSDFSNAVRIAMVDLKDQIEKQGAETPYGIPYSPHIWGAGWNIQSFG